MEATKTAEVSVQASDSLEELRQRFEQWRAGRRRGEGIPEAMWMDAAKEARARSAYRVARVSSPLAPPVFRAGISDPAA